MKEKELREVAECANCHKPFGHTGLPLFWRIRIERIGVKLGVVRRQMGQPKPTHTPKSVPAILGFWTWDHWNNEWRINTKFSTTGDGMLLMLEWAKTQGLHVRLYIYKSGIGVRLFDDTDDGDGEQIGEWVGAEKEPLAVARAIGAWNEE